MCICRRGLQYRYLKVNMSVLLTISCHLYMALLWSATCSNLPHNHSRLGWEVVQSQERYIVLQFFNLMTWNHCYLIFYMINDITGNRHDIILSAKLCCICRSTNGCMSGDMTSNAVWFARNICLPNLTTYLNQFLNFIWFNNLCVCAKCMEWVDSK